MRAPAAIAAFVVCLAAFAFALLMLVGVLRGAASDAHLLGFWTWLALVVGVAAVVSAIGRWSS